MKWKLRISLCTVALALTTVGAASAVAAEFPIRSCSQAPGAVFTALNPKWWAQPSQSAAAGAPTGGCPGGMTFKTQQPANQGATGSWAFKFDALPSVVNFRFAYEGGETNGGWEYTVNDCPSTCKTLATLPARGADDPPATFALDVVKPWLIRVTASCVQAVCDASTPLNFHDVVSTVKDETAPKASVLLSSGYWARSSDLKASVSISDVGGTGLSTSSASVDGNSSFFGQNECSLSFFYQGEAFLPADTHCEQSIYHPYQALGLDGVPDGTHNIVVDATDAAGNAMKTLKVPFRTDDTPPSTPEDAVLTGVNEYGWTQLSEIGVRWVNSGEDAETTAQSGIRLPRYSRKPFPGFTGESQTVEGKFEIDTTTSIRSVSLPSDAKWNLFVSVKDRADNESGALKITVGRDRGTPAQPLLGSTDWLNQDALNRLKLPVTQLPGSEISGICGYATIADTNERMDPPVSITDGGPRTYLTVDRDLPSGFNWFHARAVSCAGIGSATAHTQLKVDRKPPAMSVAGISSSQWTNQPVVATLTTRDDLSGVAEVSHAVEPAQLQSVAGETVKVTAPMGHHRLNFSAVDRAGNVAAIDREVRFDGAKPDVSFEKTDPLRPTQLRATVEDEHSGVANAVVEYRRTESSGEWTSLPTAMQADSVGAKRVAVAATIPDAELDPGNYDFRLHASDLAGNATAAPAGPARSLPFREPMKLTALIAEPKTCKPRHHCKSSVQIDRKKAKSPRTIKYAGDAAIVGELRDARGAPMASTKLKLYSAVGGRDQTLVDELTTDARGRYERRIERGASRRFTVRFVGSDTLLPASGTADLGVAVGARLRVDRPRIRNGRNVIFSGRVLGSTARNSAAGLRAAIFYFRPGAGWKPAVDIPITDPDGRFEAVSYRFTGALRRPMKLRFRAFVITGRTGFPYVEGFSNVASVRIRP